jgi:hypothetical protein
MKMYLTVPLVILVGPWLRRYATALLVLTLVVFTTLGVGIAQMLYSTQAPEASASESRVYMVVMLDQHERHRR